MQNAILIRYGEVWLKSKHVRRRFEQILVGNIRSLFPKGTKFHISPGRIFVYSKKVPKDLSKVFGITSYSPVYVLDKDMGAVKKLAKQLVSKWKKGKSFAIRARRTDKSFSMSSREIEIAVANTVPKGFPVDLSDPEHQINIELRDKAYIYEKEVDGQGGLPLGSGGIAAAMLRDKNDLAAAWLMMKRGIFLVFVKPNPRMKRPIGKWMIGRKVKSVQSIKKVGPKAKALVDVREKKPVSNGLVVLNPLIGFSKKELDALVKKLL